MEKYSESPKHHQETPDVDPEPGFGRLVREVYLRGILEKATKKDKKDTESA